ncbi:hypothetical protein OAI33_13470 [Pirellulaceae bacterium]|nr:hypothetical protein [Pirellulaceae bacterium]
MLQKHFLRLSLLLLVMSVFSVTCNVSAADFVLATNADGSKSTLKAKLVTHREFQKLYPKPDSGTEKDAEVLGPFSVFHQIQTDDGKTEEGDFYRVGDSKGTPLGWVKKGDVVVWKTRYVLLPVNSNISDGKFTVYNFGKIGGERTDQDAVLETPAAQEKLRLAFILSPPEKEAGDDTIYDVLCLDRTGDQSMGGVEDILKKLQDISMEVVFVYEATDGLEWEIGGKSLKTYLQTVMNNIADSFDEAGVSDMVRFGIVAFQDNTEHYYKDKPAPFTTKVIHPLTPGTSKFKQGISNMVAYMIGGDWPEDGLSGIKKACEMLDETEYSSKHIIYYGMSSPHEHPRGGAHTMWGSQRRWAARNWRSDFYDTLNNKLTGFTASNLTIKGIIDLAAPRADSPLSSKTIHTIMNTAKHEAIAPGHTAEINEFLLKFEPKVNQVVSTSQNDKMLEDRIFALDADPYEVSAVWQISQQVADYYRSQNRGLEVLKELAVNSRGNFHGFYGSANNTAAEYERVSKELFDSLNKIIPVLQAAKEGNPKAVAQLTGDGGMGKSEFTSGSFRTAAQQSIQDILGEDETSFLGSAPVRDDDGYLVAHKSVLVGRDELMEFAQKLDSMVETFKGKADRSQRTDIKKLLSDLQQYAVETVTGEDLKVVPELELKEMITELPLQTSALDMTVQGLTVLDSEEFTRWVDSIRLSHTRCQALLDDNLKWLTLTDTAPQDKFAFIRIEDMP